ncbi:MAG: hypothetical protein AAFY26_03760 [Cyanobacteria bacterium J06638_22]
MWGWNSSCGTGQAQVDQTFGAIAPASYRLRSPVLMVPDNRIFPQAGDRPRHLPHCA